MTVKQSHRPFSASGSLAPLANHSLKNVDEKGRPLAPLAAGETPRSARRMLCSHRFLDDLYFLVGQPVELVEDLVDQLVRPFNLCLRFLGAFFGIGLWGPPCS
jgi:hypothetical protein